MYEILLKKGYRVSSYIRYLVYGIAGVTIGVMIIVGIIITLAATGDIHFPRNMNLLEVPIISGIVYAWMSVKIKKELAQKYH